MRDKMIKICVVCKEEFECYNKAKYGGRKGKNKRRSNAITCSMKCSKINGSYKKVKK